MSNLSGSGVRGFNGQELLDLTGDWGASILGRRPESVLGAAREALDATCFTEHEFDSQHEAAFAETLRQSLGWGEAVMPATIGSEAVDLAIRASRRFTGRRFVLHLSRSFHGVTMGAASLCGIPGWVSDAEREPFAIEVPLSLSGHIQHDTRRQLESRDLNDACFILEPVLGNSGFRHIDSESLEWISAFCRARDILLIADEIMVGLGRCGNMLASRTVQLSPDIVLVGKALGAGIAPIAAALFRPGLPPPTGPALRSTYSWTPFTCATAVAVLHTLSTEDLSHRALRMRRLLAPVLKEISECAVVAGVHGAGLGIGIALEENGRKPSARLMVRRQALEKGVIVGANPNLPGLWLAPPLNLSELDLFRGFEVILDVLKKQEG